MDSQVEDVIDTFRRLGPCEDVTALVHALDEEQCGILATALSGRFSRVYMASQWLKVLAGSKLTELRLELPEVTDHTLPAISQLTNLHTLALHSSRVSNPWQVVTALSQLPKLTKLSFQPAVADIPAKSRNPTIFDALREDSRRRRQESRQQRQASQSETDNEPASSNTTNTNPNNSGAGPSRGSPSYDADTDSSGGEPMHGVVTAGDDDAASVDSGDFESSSDDEGSSDYFDSDVDLYGVHEGFVPAPTEEYEGESLLSTHGAFSGIEFQNFPDPYRHTLGAGHHRSTIVNSPHYRLFLVYHLTNLTTLDGLPISDRERDDARREYGQFFAPPPQSRHNLYRLLSARQVTMSTRRQIRDRELSIANAFDASRYNACSLHQEHLIIARDAHNPRQFEYHPHDPALMVVGTGQGQALLVDHYHGRVLGGAGPYQQSAVSRRTSVLGLSWMHNKENGHKFMSGRENGMMTLWDARSVAGHAYSHDDDTKKEDSQFGYGTPTKLTSIHGAVGLTALTINCVDDKVAASGYASVVQVFDVETGQEYRSLQDIHSDLTNHLRFANHSPHLLATTSMDSYSKLWDIRIASERPIYSKKSKRGNTVISFSPDDKNILVASIDNEVTQYDMPTGLNTLRYKLPSLNSPMNYTRAYYHNNGKHIIVGSCEEPCVRIACTSTGNVLRRVDVQGTQQLHYIQSLRSNPHAKHAFSVLACSFVDMTVGGELISVDLLRDRRLHCDTMQAINGD